jgi:hypothetical protein
MNMNHDNNGGMNGGSQPHSQGSMGINMKGPSGNPSNIVSANKELRGGTAFPETDSAQNLISKA